MPDVTSGAATAHWRDGHDPQHLPREVWEAFEPLAAPFDFRPLSGGLLHQSFHVRTPESEFILQRISDVFSPAIHDNIQRVGAHLRARGLPAFELLPTRSGAVLAHSNDDERWRLLTHLGGQTFSTLSGPDLAASAGALVAGFHAALADFDAPLAPLGFTYRDMPTYLLNLESALRTHPRHRLAQRIAPLAKRIFAAADKLGPAAASPAVPERLLHGDLKISNVLFGLEADVRPDAFALIDFDTLMRGPLWMDLGDAWRSWCNRSPEDGGDADFDLEIFGASLDGYFSEGALSISEAERASLVDAPERLALEVCTRFAADALQETYFDWDQTIYPAAGEHHADRAESQWHYFERTQHCRPERAALLGFDPRASRS